MKKIKQLYTIFMKNYIIVNCMLITIFLFTACAGNEMEEPEETDTTGFIEYTIDGGATQRYENLGEDCSAAAAYSGGALLGISIDGGLGSNSIIINDYFAGAAGTYTITSDLAEAELYIITLNNGGQPYAMFWGEGLGIDTGGGSITYTVYDPAETGPSHFEGSFTFTLYDLSNNPHTVAGTFAF